MPSVLRIRAKPFAALTFMLALLFCSLARVAAHEVLVDRDPEPRPIRDLELTIHHLELLVHRVELRRPHAAPRFHLPAEPRDHRGRRGPGGAEEHRVGFAARALGLVRHRRVGGGAGRLWRREDLERHAGGGEDLAGRVDYLDAEALPGKRDDGFHAAGSPPGRSYSAIGPSGIEQRPRSAGAIP